MNRVVRLVLLAAGVGVVGVGCASTPESRKRNVIWKSPQARMETLAESPDDHYERVFQVWENDRRALAEDLDLLFLTDRKSRLSKWHDR